VQGSDDNRKVSEARPGSEVKPHPPVASSPHGGSRPPSAV
jgi:hypothetical protein